MYDVNCRLRNLIYYIAFDVVSKDKKGAVIKKQKQKKTSYDSRARTYTLFAFFDQSRTDPTVVYFKRENSHFFSIPPLRLARSRAIRRPI